MKTPWIYYQHGWMSATVGGNSLSIGPKHDAVKGDPLFTWQISVPTNWQPRTLDSGTANTIPEAEVALTQSLERLLDQQTTP